MKSNGTNISLCLSVAGISGLLAAAAFVTLSSRTSRGGLAERDGTSPPLTFATLEALPLDSLGAAGIARMNLLCQEGLFGAEDVDINSALKLIAQMAARVSSETERHLYRFKQTPQDFENSEGFFRMLMVGVVLTEDFGVHYNPRQRTASADSGPGDGFFADPQMVFLSGLLGSSRQGTCSSLPVLYVAVGRQLGYPLKLVTTKGHLFVRWEGAAERFNIEATGRGVNRFEDEYYRHWPFEVSPAEEAAEGYLKSLSPAGELAVFLSIRAMCLREAGNLSGAAEAFAAASRLSPETRSYQRVASALGAAPGPERRKIADKSDSIQTLGLHSKL